MPSILEGRVSARPNEPQAFTSKVELRADEMKNSSAKGSTLKISAEIRRLRRWGFESHHPDHRMNTGPSNQNSSRAGSAFEVLENLIDRLARDNESFLSLHLKYYAACATSEIYCRRLSAMSLSLSWFSFLRLSTTRPKRVASSIAFA